MALPEKYPRIVIHEAIGWLKNLYHLRDVLNSRYDQIVENVQQKDEELNIKYVSAASEPTVSTDENALFWHDSSAGKYYLILKTPIGQKKVELT